MSLLMDALRKAEEAKRAANQSTATESAAPPHSATLSDSNSGLSLTPLDTVQPIGELTPSLPELASPAPKTSPTPNPQPASAAEPVRRSSAQNVFAAKQPEKPADTRTFLFALGGIATLALIGIGGYVWWQLQPRSAMIAGAAPYTPPPVAAHQTSPLPALPPLVPEQQAPKVTAAAEPSGNLPLSAPLPPKTETAAPLYRPARADKEQSPATPIRITRNQAAVNPLLQKGYNALQQGNLAEAQQAYERMLGSDPKNLDALYGLAAVAVARQQNSLAEDYYLRIIEIDPRDAIAQAGLADLGTRNSGNTESRLKTLIAEQPNVAQLHLALGNFYAQNQRWRDAQQAYFLAYKNDSESPDVAFNLAVSLDQLHQDKLAAQYYSEALKLAATRSNTFNRDQVQLRLRDLQAGAASRP